MMRHVEEDFDRRRGRHRRVINFDEVTEARNVALRALDGAAHIGTPAP
jgi:hypothetical protein